MDVSHHWNHMNSFQNKGGMDVFHARYVSNL